MRMEHSNGRRIIPYHGSACGDLVDDMVRNMSPTDRSELWLLSDGRPEAVLKATLRNSIYAFGYTVGDEAVVMGGLDGNNQVWMVASTELLERHKRAFLRYSLLELAAMRQLAAGKLRSGVDRRWRKSLRWMKWMGFKEVIPFSIQGRQGVVLELEDDRTLDAGIPVGHVPFGAEEALEAHSDTL